MLVVGPVRPTATDLLKSLGAQDAEAIDEGRHAVRALAEAERQDELPD